MALKTLLFGTDDMFKKLKPFYDEQVHLGNLEIVAHAGFENGKIHYVTPDGSPKNDAVKYDLAIISAHNDFYNHMKLLEAQGVPRNKIIDGRVFQVPKLNLPRLLAEGIAYGVIEKTSVGIVERNFVALMTTTIYPQRFSVAGSRVELGTKSYIVEATIERNGIISVGNFSAVSWGITFEFELSQNHNYHLVSAYSHVMTDWAVPRDFMPPFGDYRIEIGNDVWIGRGCFFKCNNPNKPLIIGDGAVIAADSVVVKDVPPYAIVGGNPAQIIKYRFEPQVIEALQRIKWWEWDIDKIHDNFKYFNDIEKFISLHDK